MKKRATRREEAMEVTTFVAANAEVDAAERLLVELRDSPVHAMVDHRMVRWRVLPVRHSYDRRALTPERRRPRGA